ncbi:Tic22 family protein [Picosynechococcus sp. NKBG15041c]|uniref:Tic22 family protein n=1 Tax=Picosynechococcus sp. NKBG15041c TaxID=1407650 RepID=UPI000429C522|nr:Tic22 family protein [Picosynechococcus sp. NKBG15041c]
MKSLVHLGQKALLMGTAIAGTVAGFAGGALALPEATVIEKLRPIPMYMLINDEGQPIFATITDQSGNESGVTGVFVSPSDAENLVANRRTESNQLLQEERAKADANPEVIAALEEQANLWEEATILPIGLDRIYQFARSNEAENLTFKFLPTMEQLNAAAEVTQQEDFPGVPLFFLSVQEKDANGQDVVSFPTLASNGGDGQGEIPVFFEVDPILEQLDDFPENEDLSINVMPLEVFIAKLLDSDLPAEEQEFLEAMTLIPPMESAQLIQSILEQQQQQQQ